MSIKDLEKKKYFVSLVMMIIAGGLDAYTYLMRGGVFAAMHTGNLIQIALCIVNSTYEKIYTFVIPLVVFIIGIIISFHVKKLKNGDIISGIAAVILYVSGFLIPHTTGLNVLSNVIISLGVALQLQIIKSINSFPVATTMCTGNMRSFGECICERISKKDKRYSLGMFIYSTLVIAFFAGVILAAIIIKSIAL